MNSSYDLAHVLRELQRLQAAGRVAPDHRVYIEVTSPAGRRPLFAATADVGQLGAAQVVAPGPAAQRAAPRVYKLDPTERLILLAIARAHPAPLTLEEIAAATKRSTSTLTYKGRLNRLQADGLLANDNDHQGYRLTEGEGERIGSDLLDEEEKE